MPARATSTDPRATRVRAKLKEAAFGLILERRIESISTADVMQRADISRPAFYQHFRDRDDVVAQAVSDSIRSAVDSDEGVTTDPAVVIHRLFEYFTRYAMIYRNIYPSGASQRMADTIRELLQPAATALAHQLTDRHAQLLTEDDPQAEELLETLSTLLTGAVIEVSRRWADTQADNASPDTAATLRRHFDASLRLLGLELSDSPGEQD
ncbi:TetR/AcrR family transcriptional regulator [Streptomyces sp. NBC_00820]|uniref:TetR/AcrR family transcriptional regulator n=1 Tax=Streptomyces sp. NBC_00820 TaxID=2975842 RepID=UPI002ED09CE1|nr:TetR/AcrR family transcriptional regulator [Streptomyces sp. NBC_00820]